MTTNQDIERVAQEVQDMYFENGAIVDIGTWNKTKELIGTALLEAEERGARKAVEYLMERGERATEDLWYVYKSDFDVALTKARSND